MQAQLPARRCLLMWIPQTSELLLVRIGVAMLMFAGDASHPVYHDVLSAHQAVSPSCQPFRGSMQDLCRQSHVINKVVLYCILSC